MPVFNRERFVDAAIRSVLEQDFDDFELLLVDDGSTDGTPEILAAWTQRDPRVVVVTSPTNQGLPGALNLGLAHARGRYVARLDSDDFMMPRRLAAQAAVLDARPEVVLVSCAYDIVDMAGNHLRTWKGDEPHEVVVFLLHFFNGPQKPKVNLRGTDAWITPTPERHFWILPGGSSVAMKKIDGAWYFTDRVSID